MEVGNIISSILTFFVPLIIFVYYIYALIDILKNEFTGNNKLIWLIIYFILPLVGVLLYFLIGRKQKIPKIQKSN
ncbi:PLDc N-terminal domain-containing protein [Arcobacter sp. KX21116]|jgi:positive regulator of sigma E activity|uniref:PLDc N-terminal domain-containing protein n=1 Tax=Arcobacter iocasae TaxID=2906515 RepID=UPI0035D4518C